MGATDASQPPSHDHQAAGGPLACPACRVLDRADGAEDGQMSLAHPLHVRHERVLVERFKRTEDRAADKVTAFAGSLKFVYLHGFWFGLWILANIGAVAGLHHFDPFPFGLLTMIVSLEAIFLSTFVMVSQNRQAARADIRSEVDFENNLRGEIWAVHIGARLGIDPEHVEEVTRTALAAYRRDEVAS